MGGKTAALLMHEIPATKWHFSLSTKMSEDDNLFADQSLLWDCDGCAPPSFNIPPPPRPPWMENLDHCADQENSNNNQQESLAQWLGQLQTCENISIRDPPSAFEDVFHSIAIIVVSAIVLVIFILSVGLYVFKKRKTFRECHQRSSGGLSGLNSNTLHRGPTRYVGNVNPAIDCSTPTHLSHTLGPIKPNQVLYEGQAITSLTPSGHTMTRCLANHYTPDAPNHLTLDHKDHMLRKQAIAEEFRQRFGHGPERRNIMELSERPPMPIIQNHHTIQNPAESQHAYQVSNASDYPHIVIGGKPFFLVPSSHQPSSVLETTVNNSEAYAYPQHQQMPIYEEIDYTTVSAPMSSGSIMMDRPLSSAASHSNSAHTNTSELSSGSVGTGDSSSSNSSQKIIIDSAMIMPEVSQPVFIPPRHFTTSSQQNRVRLADGVLRSASPQSPFSARLSGKNQNKPAGSNSNSVYYYSDTIKKPPLQHNSSSEDTVSLDLKPISTENTSNKVNTKVTLIEEKDTGSTLV